MANSNKKNVLNNMKMQAASEVGVPLKDNGYNGDLTAKQAGSIGGQMVKMMIPERLIQIERANRTVTGHKAIIRYIIRTGI